MEELKDRVAVVTGGASGIGLGMARAFAAEGMRISLADIEEQPLQQALGQLRDAGASAIATPCDVAKGEGAFGAHRTLTPLASAVVRATGIAALARRSSSSTDAAFTTSAGDRPPVPCLRTNRSPAPYTFEPVVSIIT